MGQESNSGGDTVSLGRGAEREAGRKRKGPEKPMKWGKKNRY